MEQAADLLRVRGLHKRYALPVLVDFDFEVRHGEIHALVGSNGAGKSTLARILSGLTTRDDGDVLLDGRPYSPRSSREAERAGIILVPQEPSAVSTLSIAENLFLSRLPARGGFVRFDRLQEESRRALARVGLDAIDPATPAGMLSVGHQQLVAIASALSQPCRLIILDEPTAALTDAEIERFFGHIRRLRDTGAGVVFVSHRLDELRRIADRVTVMRDGRRVATHDSGNVTPAELVREMVGHALPERGPSVERPAGGGVALSVRGLRAGPRVRDVGFDVRRGEVLGVAGLVGAGRTEMLRAIFGADPTEAGDVFLDHARLAIRRPADAVRAGIGLVPEDRARDGLLMSQSVRANVTLSTVQRDATHGWIDADAEARTTDALCRLLDVRSASREQPVSELSGGNQQKVVIARWLARDCDVLLFDEPTRGIDVATKDAIYALLRDLAAKGKAIVVASSDLVELMAICDRLIVMSLGRVTGEFSPGEWTQETILEAAFRGHRAATDTPAAP